MFLVVKFSGLGKMPLFLLGRISLLKLKIIKTKNKYIVIVAYHMGISELQPKIRKPDKNGMLNKIKRKQEKEARIIMSIIKKKKYRVPLFSPHRTVVTATEGN